MRCHHCGAELAAGTTYCDQCGAEQRTDASSEGVGGRGAPAEERPRADRQRRQGSQERTRRSSGDGTGHQRGRGDRQAEKQGARDGGRRRDGQRSRDGGAAGGHRGGGGGATDARSGENRAAQGGDRGGRARSRGQERPRAVAGDAGTGSLTDRYAVSRLAAVGAGALALVGVVLPWVEARMGGQSWDALATPFGAPAALLALLGLAFAAGSWGGGWGWLTMLLSGLAGVGVAGLAFIVRLAVAEDDTLGTIELEGTDVPVAAVEPGFGVTLTVLAGVVLALAASAGIVSTLANR